MRPVVGVIGGGQLARMMIAPAVELDIDLRVFGQSKGEPAALAVTRIGDHRMLDDVLRFADGVDVVTFDHEHVPSEVLAGLVAAGYRVEPGPAALRFAQDKLEMRRRLGELGVPMPDWAAVTTLDEARDFLDGHGGRAVVKTPTGGYDGKGVAVVSSVADILAWRDRDGALGGPLLIEELVDFRRELSQLSARRRSGEQTMWPVVESIQRDGVCVEVIAPAPDAPLALRTTASAIASTVATSLDVTGVLAVELFETTDDRLLVNELAMRPHNSGHWTMDGSATGQFEQHLRAVLDLPLGPTAVRSGWSVMVNILGGTSLDRRAAAFRDQPGAKVHLYGKEPRPGRKVGHVTVTGDDLDDVVFRARAASAHFED